MDSQDSGCFGIVPAGLFDGALDERLFGFAQPLVQRCDRLAFGRGLFYQRLRQILHQNQLG